MENSDKLVDDEQLAEAMKERGLGTPATRAAIIEKLLKEKYIVREGRDLTPTGKAFELLGMLSHYRRQGTCVGDIESAITLHWACAKHG